MSPPLTTRPWRYHCHISACPTFLEVMYCFLIGHSHWFNIFLISMTLSLIRSFFLFFIIWFFFWLFSFSSCNIAVQFVIEQCSWHATSIRCSYYVWWMHFLCLMHIELSLVDICIDICFFREQQSGEMMWQEKYTLLGLYMEDWLTAVVRNPWL